MIKALIPEQEAEKFLSLIEKSEKIVVTCHVRPDGDALGSSLGIASLLESMGRKTNVVTPDQAPKSLSFLPGLSNITSYSQYPEYAQQLMTDADLIICCDFNKPSRQDSLGSVTAAATAPKVLIDHHMNPAAFCDLTFSYPEMSSTCELMFRIICAMGLYDRLPLDGSICLATGIITDTRNLSVNCHDPELYIIMYELMKKGVEDYKEMILRQALMLKSADSFRLSMFALSERLKLIPTHKAAVIALSKEDLERFHYEKGDTEGLVNQPLNIDGIVQSYQLREDRDCIKISARSIGAFPVSEVCETLFGGGGHLQAAGAEYRDGTLDECCRILEESLSKFDKYLPKSSDKHEKK